MSKNWFCTPPRRGKHVVFTWCCWNLQNPVRTWRTACCHWPTRSSPPYPKDSRTSWILKSVLKTLYRSSGCNRTNTSYHMHLCTVYALAPRGGDFYGRQLYVHAPSNEKCWLRNHLSAPNTLNLTVGAKKHDPENNIMLTTLGNSSLTCPGVYLSSMTYPHPAGHPHTWAERTQARTEARPDPSMMRCSSITRCSSMMRCSSRSLSH